MTFPHPFFYPVAGPGAEITVSFEASAVQYANQSSYTFSGVAIGTAAADRTVVVAVMHGGGNTTPSVTIGGTGAAIAANGSGSGTSEGVSIYYLDVAAGATANIVVNFSSTEYGCAIGVWAMYGADSAPHDSDTSLIGDPASASIDVPAGGAAFAAVCNRRIGNNNTYSWTGLSEDFDLQSLSDSSDDGASGASEVFSAAQTGLTVTATPSATSRDPIMAVASWGPA